MVCHICHVDLIALEATTELSDEGTCLMLARNVIERLQKKALVEIETIPLE